MKTALLFSSFVILVSSFAQTAPDRWMDKQDLFTVGDNADYNLYHIPGIVVTAKGTVLAWCEARKRAAGVSDWDDIRILLRRSTDEGKTWSEPKSIANVEGPKAKNPFALKMKNVDPNDVTYNNPVLIADKDGTVHMLFCLEYERTNLSSIAGFIAWLEATSANLKRDMEQGAGEVRVMTVHGAKGLEAPIVFLPDTCTKPDGRKVAGVLYDTDAAGLPVWRIRKDFAVEATTTLEAEQMAAMQREHNRLLYVAMTRARDRLYVCGFLKSKKADGWQDEQPVDGTWYHAIRRALVEAGQTSEVDDAGKTIWRFGSGAIRSTGKPDEPVRSNPAVALPGWATLNVPAVERPLRWLSPSRLGEADAASGADGWSSEVALSPLAPAQDRRFRRGSLVHRLLQSLPDLPAGDRDAAARRYLARNGVEDPELSATVSEVMALFGDARFAGVFSADARAEVAMSAMVSPPGAASFGISGQIDRLLVTADKVLVVDFKTNRPPPDDVGQVPAAYLRQLAAYAHVLHGIYPSRTIECALLWTDVPRLMPVPQSMLDKAWGAPMFKTA